MRPSFNELLGLLEVEVSKSGEMAADLKFVDDLKRELREGEERQRWEIEQKRQEGQKRLRERMLLVRKMRSEKKKEEKVVIYTEAAKIIVLEQRLLELESDNSRLRAKLKCE